MAFGIDTTTGAPFLSVYLNRVSYKMYVEDDSVKIDAFLDDAIYGAFSHTYEVAILFPVSKDASESGHLDKLVVLDKDNNIVAYQDDINWIYAFIQCELGSDYIEVYEKMFHDIIRQINFGGKHVGK